MHDLPFDQRACFIAGQAKSGTTLLAALLDSHPELLVLPRDTAYFATALTKYGPKGRRAQFDYLTQHSWARPLFGFGGKRNPYFADFPKKEFLANFERAVFDPANAQRDLLVLMMESYAHLIGVPIDRVKRWVEKTPANRNYVPEIFARFPHAKLLFTMRDPRALLAAQIRLEQTRKTGQFSSYYVIAHWRLAARLAKQIEADEIPGLLVPYEKLVREPSLWMQKICDYLEIAFDPAVVLNPTKVGRLWTGNSAAGTRFSQISAEPATRWEGELSESEMGWVEWHCRDLMPDFGYKPKLTGRAMRHFAKPIRGERPREFLKSRAYSLRDGLWRR
jgi:Sulfotransferase family